MMKFFPYICIFFFLFAFFSCDKGLEKVPSNGPAAQNSHQNQMPKMPQTNANATKKSNRKIVVPPAVKEKWGGAKLKITDKQSNKDTVISLTLGEPTKFEAGNLTLTADSFLPSFFISGDTITSIDAEDKNPGVKLLVQEGDKELMDNWIFAKMPNIHAFSHPKWSITLIGGIPK